MPKIKYRYYKPSIRLNEGTTRDLKKINDGKATKMAKNGNKWNLPVYSKSGEALQFYSSLKGPVQFSGFGVVHSIQRGENLDVIQVRFGLINRVREITVHHNQARRQIMTLKRGQYAIFFGEARLHYKDVETPKGKFKMKYWLFMAYAIQGLFVPRISDIKKHDKEIEQGIEEEQAIGMSEEKEQYFQSLIDDLFDRRSRDTLEDDNDVYVSNEEESEENENGSKENEWVKNY